MTNHTKTQTFSLAARLPLPFVLAGLAALYIGERALSGGARIAVDLVGLLVPAALVLAFLRRRATTGARRQAATRILVEYVVVAAAMALYFLQSDLLGVVPDGKLATAAMVVWPALLLLGLAPAVAMELSLLSMARAPDVESWRVRVASRGARIVVLGIIGFAGVNYAAAQWNRKIDLSYFKTTVPGSSTLALAEGLTEPVRFVLFFPPGNEVLEQVRGYVETLAAKSEQVQLELADQALDPELARELKVRSNGYLVIQSGEQSESIRVGLEVEEARSTLRDLDAKIHEDLLRLVRPPRKAYFTTGHLERDWAAPADDTRTGLRQLKALFEALGFRVERLGLGEGLGSRVPEDATVVVVPGPLEPFLPEERAALEAYAERGGRLLVLLDPDRGVTEEDLLASLGVKVSQALVANDNPRYLVRVKDRRETPYDLATNRTSAHPSVTTLSRAGGRLGVVLLGSGGVSKIDRPSPELNVTFTLRSMPESWLDSDGNGSFDAPGEKRTGLDFAAAVERRAAAEAGVEEAAAGGEAASTAPDAAEPRPMRAVVVDDADVAADPLLDVPGNMYFLADSVRWLAGDEDTAGAVESEKDVPIVHRKEEDTIWFYGTSFLVPAAVLAIGLFVSRKGSRRRRES